MSESTTIQKTPLYEIHQKHNARLINFGGWLMPVQYKGLIEEHLTVREKVGLFDVSHMGEIEIIGKDALEFVNYVTTNDVAKLKTNQVQYSSMCYENGGIVDDILVYCINPEHYFLCVNASNTAKDYNWLVSQNKTNLKIQNNSNYYCQISIQGRFSEKILQEMVDVDLSQIKYYWFKKGHLACACKTGIESIISRTGYTGEDGFEIYFDRVNAECVWDRLMEIGKPYGIACIGLGARDTLRLEMNYRLYGNDMSAETNPIEADLEWIVKLNKGDFIGRKPIELCKTRGLERKLVGFELLEKGIPRHDYKIYSSDNEVVGIVTSGTMSPSLKKAIGTGYVKSNLASLNQTLLIEIRGKKTLAKIVNTPFYKRTY